MKSGWIKMPRSLLDWPWYTDSNAKCVFLHLMLTVAYAPGFWQGIELVPGQTVTTVAELAQQTGLTVSQTRTALNKLESSGDITRKTTNKFTLVTLVKFSVSGFSEDQNSKQNSIEIANESQTNRKRTLLEKKVKNEKKERHHQESDDVDTVLKSLLNDGEFSDIYNHMCQDADLREYLGKMDTKALHKLYKLTKTNSTKELKDYIDKVSDYAPEHFVEYLEKVCGN